MSLTCWSILFREGEHESVLDLGAFRNEEGVTRAILRAATPHRDSVERQIASSGRRVMKDLLDVPVTDRLIEAFCGYRELYEYTDPKRHPTNETSIKEYIEQKMDLEMEPRIRIRVDHFDLPSIKVKASLQLKATGVSLAILGGRIVSLTVGSLEGTGTLTIGRSEVWKTPKARLFDGFTKDLGAGWPIAPSRRGHPTEESVVSTG